MFRRNILFIVLSFFIVNCSLDYRSAFESEKLEEKIPDTILINFKHIVVEDNKKLFQIEAKQALIFNADHARFHSDTENAEIWGSVYFYSAREGAQLTTDSLSWEKDSRILKANPEDLVRINKDDGSFIQGRGFLADMRRKSVSFLSQVWGKIVREGEEK
jgi:hypothetical protein